MKSIREIPLHGQTVFLRVDFNVPLDDEGNIREDARIKAALPTIEYILQKGAKLIVASHLGRPKGKIVEKLRLQPVAKRLQQLLGQDIKYVDDCVGREVQHVQATLENGEIMLLENLRFYAEEEANDIHFAEQLAEGVDVYITDAFGAIHRKHASTFALPSIVFDKGVGFLVEKEIDALDKIIHEPEQPLVVVIGGVKISDKVDVIRNLAPMADVVLVGGGVANTFLTGLGKDVGASIVESDSVSKKQESINYVDVAHEIWQRFETEKPHIDVKLPDGSPITKIQTPLDFIAAPNREEGAETTIVEVGDTVPEGWMFLDIGPKTQQLFADVLKKANTIFWNGPVGLFEQDAYSNGSRVLAETIAECKGYAVLGGGDTEVVTKKFNVQGKYSHISTGGGASLAYLAQQSLPGLEALD